MPDSNFQRGSEWRKWDLHIHSPLSILNNQYPKVSNGDPNWEQFLQKLESLNVAAIGITDYFTIDGYKAIKKFKEEGRLQNIHSILPNIEFRLKEIISSRSGDEKRLNFHVIFSDDVSVEDIEEHFLHDIPFYFQGDPQNRDESRKLKISNLENFGRELMSQHAPFRDMGVSPLEIGAMQAVVDHKEITNILAGDSRFKGKYLIVLDADGWDQINWNNQAHLVRKALLQKSDMVFSSSAIDRRWCLGEDPYQEGSEHFKKEFKTLKPCIHGSDAHRIEDIARPCARRGDKTHTCDNDSSGCELRHCWIKADPTFEGLKQLLYEPEERVAIQTNNPSPIISNYTINKIHIKGETINDELSLSDTDIEINPFLVAVVGGKGAGKTALVDLVANCYKDRRVADDGNSFVRRIAEYEPNLEVSLLFRDGSEFSKNLEEDKLLEDSQIVYIAQAELEKYIGEKSDLHQRIKELIFDSPQIQNSLLSFEFYEAIAATEELDKKLSAKNRAVEELVQKTNTETNRAIEREQKKIDSDLQDIDKRIKEFEKVQSASVTEAAKKGQERLGSLKSRKDDLSSLRDTLEQMLEFLEEEVGGLNEMVKTANDLMKKLEIKEELPELSYTPKTKIEKVVASVKTDIKQVASEIDKEQKRHEKLERGVREHAKLLEHRRELQAISKSVEKKIKQLEIDQKRLQGAELERKQLMKELLESIIAQKKKYKEVIETFSGQQVEVLLGIDFVAEVRFNDDLFLDKAEGILDNRKIEVKGDDQNPPAFDDLVKLSHAVADGNDLKIDKLVEEIELRCKNYKTKIKSEPVTIGDFYDLLYKNYMQVIPVVKYKNVYLEKNSLGQKATVLIKIYLAHGDKPIIIDSHDDHLDNAFIMEELVQAIRKAKSDRQIILVSNNGNVVINSDAEQIIVANRDNDTGEISYTAGSIENPEIREEALRVLEGGREAFKKRQEKYRMTL